MNRCLITGAGGFIASHCLAHLLLNTDWEIIGIDSFRHKGISERITDSIHYQAHKARVQVFTHDLTAPLSHVLQQKIGKIDVIINFASQSHVDRSIQEPVPFVENNVKLMLNLLELARQVKPEAFVQVSTDEVYGPAIQGIKHKEWSALLPSNPYSASKCCQENLAIAYWRTYGIPIIILNTMNNFGAYQDPEKFIPSTIKKILAEQVVTIHGEPGNIGSRYYLHARNFADAILYILKHLPPINYRKEKDDETQYPSRYNVVGEKEVNNLELAQFIAKTLNKPLKYKLEEVHKQRPGHDRRYALDGNKLATHGWKTPQNFETSLQNTIKWYLENPKWLNP